MTDIDALRQELVDVEAVLAEAGERWLEAKAAGRDTSPIDLEVTEATRVSRRLNEKIRRAEKRRR